MGRRVSYCDHTFVSTPTLPVCTSCGQTPNASPSQLETWIGCKRKHAYRRSRPRTQNKYAAYGTDVHAHLESWLRDGTAPDLSSQEGRTAMAGLHLLPMPRTPGLIVEPRLQPTMLGVRWDMRIDYLCGYVPDRVIVVGDHKTTRSISEYAKTPETLATEDPQGIAYTYWAAHAFRVSHVVGQWTYYQRDGKHAAKPVLFVVSRDDVTARFTRMHHEHVLPMVRSRASPPEDLPRNLDHCDAFGRCPYIDECHAGLTPTEQAAYALKQIRKATA